MLAVAVAICSMLMWQDPNSTHPGVLSQQLQQITQFECSANGGKRKRSTPLAPPSLPAAVAFVVAAPIVRVRAA